MMIEMIKNVYAAATWEGGNAGGVPSVLPDDPLSSKFSNVGVIIGGKKGQPGLLQYVYVIAGLILLLMLISGGFTLMTAAGDPDKTRAGYGMIRNALVGFIIIFVSYLVAKIVEAMFGISFL